MTALELASAIRNRVLDGLSGNVIGNSYSLEQILDEIDLTRNELVQKFLHTGKLNSNELVQRLEERELVCTPMNPACNVYGMDEVPAIKVPSVASSFNKDSIVFLGLHNKQRNFKVYYDIDDIINHKARAMTAHREFAWYDNTLDANGLATIYFFNMQPNDPLKYLDMYAIFNHPSQVPGFKNKEYPAPGHIQKMILDMLSASYIEYYRKLNISPIQVTNTQLT